MTMNTETLEKELRLDENYEQSDWFSRGGIIIKFYGASSFLLQ